MGSMALGGGLHQVGLGAGPAGGIAGPSHRVEGRLGRAWGGTALTFIAFLTEGPLDTWPCFAGPRLLVSV